MTKHPDTSKLAAFFGQQLNPNPPPLSVVGAALFETMKSRPGEFRSAAGWSAMIHGGKEHSHKQLPTVLNNLEHVNQMLRTLARNFGVIQSSRVELAWVSDGKGNHVSDVKVPIFGIPAAKV